MTGQPIGRRERKKAQTRDAIQQHALRLFTERGYDATTLAEIAEAADVSETTLLRYFPTKQSLVLWDDFGTGIAAVFRAQPTDLRPVSALRATFHQVFGAAITQTQRADVRARVALLLSAPPLRSLLLDELHGPAQLMRELIAERTGAEPDDLPTRTLVGAVIGVSLSALFAAERDPSADILTLLDDAMGELERLV
ncbi:TetR family transcriptional regulator [Fodinicola feengrottensis]|uniref:TetR family transcriptional regulator n=1 Tax=Fodinicola feengrottensis TaxID=435914 RepID=A0ABN2H5Q1_9ACTN